MVNYCSKCALALCAYEFAFPWMCFVRIQTYANKLAYYCGFNYLEAKKVNILHWYWHKSVLQVWWILFLLFLTTCAFHSMQHSSNLEHRISIGTIYLPLVSYWVRLVKFTQRKSCRANLILGPHNQKSFSLLLCGISGFTDNRQKRHRYPHPLQGECCRQVKVISYSKNNLHQTSTHLTLFLVHAHRSSTCS